MLASRIVLALAWVLGISSSGWAHTYRIYNFPASDRGVSCADRAVEYAHRLGQIEGVTVRGQLCEYDDLVQRYTIVIGYDAAQPLNLVSTYTFWATYDDKGIYQTRDECLKNLQNEEQTFFDETGLQVFASFCAHERLSKKRPWYFHIDGFGQAQREPGRASWSTNSIYGLTFEELFQDIAMSLKKYGSDLKHLVLRPSATMGEATVFYYGPAETVRTNFFSSPVMSLRGLSACQRQVSNLRHQMEDSGKINLITSYCSSSYSGPTRFELTVVYENHLSLREVYSAEAFNTLEACLESEEKIASQMHDVYGENIVAALCGSRTFTGSLNPTYHVIGLDLKRIQH